MGVFGAKTLTEENVSFEDERDNFSQDERDNFSQVGRDDFSQEDFDKCDFFSRDDFNNDNFSDQIEFKEIDDFYKGHKVYAIEDLNERLKDDCIKDSSVYAINNLCIKDSSLYAINNQCIKDDIKDGDDCCLKKEKVEKKEKEEISTLFNNEKFTKKNKIKAIYSKKFIETPLSDQKIFHQNKRIILYKTEMCRSFGELGFCKYGERCQFCHSIEELRKVERHPKYKTEICKTFWSEGSCPYGGRCCFIHLENSCKPKLSISVTDTVTDRLVTDRLVTDRLVTDRLVTDRLVTDRLGASINKEFINEKMTNNEFINEDQVNVKNMSIDYVEIPLSKINFSEDSNKINSKSVDPNSNNSNSVDSKTVNSSEDLCTNSKVSQKHISSEFFLVEKLFLIESQKSFFDIFGFSLRLAEEARKLENDNINSIILKRTSHDTGRLFSSIKSINEIKIEKESIFNRNFIKKWKDDPVFFIFENNKYDKF